MLRRSPLALRVRRGRRRRRRVGKSRRGRNPFSLFSPNLSSSPPRLPRLRPPGPRAPPPRRAPPSGTQPPPGGLPVGRGAKRRPRRGRRRRRSVSVVKARKAAAASLSSFSVFVAILVNRLEHPAGALPGLARGPGRAPLLREAPEEVVEGPRGGSRARRRLVRVRRRTPFPSSSPVTSPREQCVGLGDFQEAGRGAADVGVVSVFWSWVELSWGE